MQLDHMSSKMEIYSDRKICFLTVCGVIEMVLFSGVIYGWANMTLILKGEGYFRDLCPTVNSTSNATMNSSLEEGLHKCVEQDNRLSLMFILAVFTFCVSGFIGGVIFDRFGTHVTRLISCIFFSLAGVSSFFLEKDTANLMFAVLICLAIAGMLVAISLYQIAQLHSNHRLAVSSLFSGALDSSSVVFLIFKGCYDAGVRFRWILVTYTSIAVVWIMTYTFVFLPKTSFASEGKGGSERFSSFPRVYPEYGTFSTVYTFDDDFDSRKPRSPPELAQGFNEQAENEKYSSGWRYILTAKFLWLFYYVSLLQLRLWFFVSILPTFLIFLTDNDKDEVDIYTRSFGIAQFFGFFFAPFTGIVMDLQPKKIGNPYFGPILSFIITNVLCLLLGGLVLVPISEVQYLSFVVQVAMRAFLYASSISFIIRAFPVVHYGKLYGFCTMAAAATTLLQIPAIICVAGPLDGNPFWVNVGFFTLSFSGFGLPLYLWRSTRTKKPSPRVQ